MNSHDKKVLLKIREHAEHIIEYVSDIDTLETFTSNTMTVEACVFNLMQIGELAHSSLSAEAKTAMPTIPWHDIYGMRNRIVHGYDEVRMDVVWDTAKLDLKPLINALNDAIGKTDN